MAHGLKIRLFVVFVAIFVFCGFALGCARPLGHGRSVGVQQRAAVQAHAVRLQEPLEELDVHRGKLGLCV